MLLILSGAILPAIAAAQGAPEGEHKLTRAPKLLQFVEARYPEDKKAAQITSQVVLSIEIGADGKVGGVEVVKSGGADFDAAAVEAARQFVFQPAEIDDQPAPVKITYRYDFTIKEEIVKLGPQVNFEGTVLERFSKKKLAGVKVTLSDLGLSATTNAEGYFSFVDVPLGPHKVETTGPGLVSQSTDETIEPGQKKTIKYLVTERDPAADSEEVIRVPRIKKETATTTIRTEEARRVPGTQGDTLKVVQNLPGVARSSFGSGQLVVWGSAPSETQVFVDGVSIPTLYHIGGLRSTVNSDMVKSIELSPGAYGADYGGGLGGLVRVETRSLPPEGVHGYLGADFIDASGMISAALGRKLRLAVSGRYSYLDRLLPLVTKSDFGDFVPIPRYDDYQAQASLSLRKDEELTATFLASDDHLKRSIASQDPAEVRSEVTDTSFKRVFLRYSRVLADGASLQVTPYFGYDSSIQAQTQGAASGGLTDCLSSTFTGWCVGQNTWRYGLRTSFRRKLQKWATLSAGAEVYGSHDEMKRLGSINLPAREGDITVFGQKPGDEISVDRWSVNLASVAPYAFVELGYGPLSVTPGFRVQGFLIEGSRLVPSRNDNNPPVGFSRLEWGLDPRLAVSVKATPYLVFNAAAGLYHQAPDPRDLSSVFGNPALGLSSAAHYTVGAAYKLTGTLSLELVGFYKTFDHLVSRNAAPTPPVAQALVQEGIGRSFGGQLLLRQDLLRGVFGWITYSVSRSERKDHPDSDWRRFDYDQTHVLGVLLSWAIGRGFTVGARFRLATGYPRTPVVSSYFDARKDEYQPLFGAHNSTEVPLFYALDLRAEKSFTFRGFAMNIYLDVQNVTNHNNPEEIIYTYDYQPHFIGNKLTNQQYINGLPVLAVIGLRLER